MNQQQLPKHLYSQQDTSVCVQLQWEQLKNFVFLTFEQLGMALMESTLIECIWLSFKF